MFGQNIALDTSKGRRIKNISLYHHSFTFFISFLMVSIKSLVAKVDELSALINVIYTQLALWLYDNILDQLITSHAGMTLSWERQVNSKEGRGGVTLYVDNNIHVKLRRPVVQKPINANLGLNLLSLGLNFNPRLLCVVQN